MQQVCWVNQNRPFWYIGGKMSNCLIYSRVSTDEQAEKGRSIDDQVKICSKYAKDNRIQVVGIYKDPGKSATNMNRPGLQDLLIRCKEDDSIGAVLVQDTDRLARNTMDHLGIKATLKKCAVQVISVSQPGLSGDAPENDLIDTIMASVNAFQSQITGRKTAKTLQEKVKEGWWPGYSPLGYKNEKIDGKNVIVLDNERAPYCEKLFTMFLAGTVPVETIADKLYQEGFRSRCGGLVHRSTLYEMLKNPFYTGRMVWKDQIYQGNHPAIISEEIFDHCQEIMEMHNKNAVRTRKHNFLLRGFIFCGECGGRIYTDHHVKASGLVFDHYFCQHCKKQYCSRDEMDKEIAKIFKKVQLPKYAVDKVMQLARDIKNETHGEIDKNKNLLLTRKVALERKRNMLESKLLEGVVDNDVYQRQHGPIVEEIKEIEHQIANLSSDRSDNIKAMEQLLLLSRNIYEAYLTAPEELKKRYLRLFWERIEVFDGKPTKLVPNQVYQLLFTVSDLVDKPNAVRKNNNWLRE